VNATYTWTFPGGTPNSFNGTNPPQICYNTAGTFTAKLKVADNSGIDSTTLDITVQNCPVPVALFSASSLNICQGDSVLFTDQSSNAATWSWTFPGGTPSTFNGQNPPFITFANPGVFNVNLLITDGASLDSTYSLTITVTNCGAPIPAFTASQTTICEGDCIQFFDQSTSNPQGWYWSFPGGIPSFSTQQNPPYICYNSPGVYPVTLRVFNNLGIDSLTVQAYIVVNSTTQVSTTFDSTTIILGESVTLGAGGGISYIWYPDFFLTNDSISNPVATPTDTTVYTVVMTDLNGCTSATQVKVNVRPPNQVFIPNMFTPNSDGVNDFIKLYTTGVIERVEFNIFDRWGNRVFFADDVNERWDGTYHGKNCNTGVYAYFYRVAFADGRVIKGKGDITLVR
jgi:gliding motility-associated-like protein